MLILCSKSDDLFFSPPHFRSDHLDPGREPGRELGRADVSLITMLGTLRNEGASEPGRSSIDLLVRASPPGDNVSIVFFRALRAEAGRSSEPGEEALALRDRPLGSSGASSGVGSETDLIATGRSTATAFSKGTAGNVGRDSDGTGDNDVED